MSNVEPYPEGWEESFKEAHPEGWKEALKNAYSDAWEDAVKALRVHCPEAPLLASPREKRKFEDDWDARFEEKSK